MKPALRPDLALWPELKPMIRALPHFLLSISLVAILAVPARGGEQRISLPEVDANGQVPVERAIEQRRSIREYRRRSLALDDVSQLLWAAQGITERDGLRAAPSAGARYPLEMYVVAKDVTNLEPGVYRYRPRRHDLVLVTPGAHHEPLAAAAVDQVWVRRAPIVLVITGVYERTTEKYGRRGHRYVHIEVGHVAQNIYLQATARGLGTVLVGAFDDSEVQSVLGLPTDHEPLGLMPVGRAR